MCTCETNCSTCGPTGTGCVCPKDKCDCAECPNKAHTSGCSCGGSRKGCLCTKDGKVCECTS